MQNFNINTYKIKKIFRSAIFRIALVSFITIILTLGIIFSIAWHYREQVFDVLAVQYNNKYKPAPQTFVLDEKDELVVADESIMATDIPVEEDTVVGAVKKAKPAVVSIVVSKEIPKYEIAYEQRNATNPFGVPIPDLFLQVPVQKQVGTERKQIGSGSGFFISSSGTIITNRHVVSDKTAIYEVQLNNGKKYDAEVLARDGVLDVAMMKIKGSNFPYLELGDSDTLDVGESVIAIGNSLGEFKNTVSVGVVSGLSRSVTASDNSGQVERLDKVIQTDAAINPGNSGGPLLNLKGQVIGINVAIIRGSSNVGFALPVNNVKSIIDSVNKTGKIVRPYVGVRYVNVTPALKTKNNLSVDYGVLIQRGENPADIAIVPGSPAVNAGIVEGDIILAIDGVKIDEDNNFTSVIRSKKVGNTIKVKLLSNGVERTVSVKLAQAPEDL